jgi:hypothetical protein
MLRSRLAALLFVPLAFMLMGARTVQIQDPPPISVPPGLTVKEVSKAIRQGLSKRDWQVTEDAGGKIDAMLHNRKHVVKVQIPYTKQTVRITYVSSENLNYEEKNGLKFIHRAYQKWIDNLVMDISNSLQSAALDKK